jgi:hypothetical protein
MAGAAFSDPGRRGSVVLGIILIVVGAIFFIDRVTDLDIARFGWPLFVVVPGILLLVAGLSMPGNDGSGLAVAGSITTVVGVILAIQNATGLWATWAYAWALVGPGGAGLGLVLHGLVHRRGDEVTGGARSVGVALAMFAAFGLFFEGLIGLSGEPFLRDTDVLPAVLIGAGVVVLAWGVLRGRRD